MIIYRFKKTVFALLVVFPIFTSCHSQVKTDLPKELVPHELSFTSQSEKLTKTQDSDQSQNTRCSLQDKEGNLWFGTTGEGVYRYDGKLFTQYTVKDGLNSNKVWSILEDRSGNIWFGTTDGVCRYDGATITRVPIHENFAPTSGDNAYYNDWSTKKTVWSMLQDKSGKIWFGTGDGVYCYDGTVFARFLDTENVINKDSLHLKMVDCILEDKNGNIWFASGMLPGQEGLCLYDGKSLIRFKPGNDSWIRSVLEDKDGIIWSSGRLNGNWCYDGKTFTKFTLKEEIGTPLLVDKAGKIWFSGEERINTVESKNGIWCYDGRTFENFTIDHGIGKYSVWSMLEDSSGNIWFGTRNCGLYRYDGQNFKIFSE